MQASMQAPTKGNQKLKVGRVDNKRVDRFDMPVHERKSLKFALADLPANVARLLVDGYMIAQCTPKYENGLAILNFFGEDVEFHRGLLDCDVILQIECEREKDYTTMPSMRVGFSGAELPQMQDGIYDQKVTIDNKEKTLRYRATGCEFV
jgi:hypothetical protein